MHHFFFPHWIDINLKYSIWSWNAFQWEISNMYLTRSIVHITLYLKCKRNCFSFIKSIQVDTLMSLLMTGGLMSMRSTQGSHMVYSLFLNFFMLYIKDLPNIILRSLLNIYAVETTSTTKNVDDRNLEADFYSDLDRTAKWRLRWFVRFDASKAMIVNVLSSVRTNQVFLVFFIHGERLHCQWDIMPGISIVVPDDFRFQLHIVYVACKIQRPQSHGSKRFIIIEQNPSFFVYVFLSFMMNN